MHDHPDCPHCHPMADQPLPREVDGPMCKCGLPMINAVWCSGGHADRQRPTPPIEPEAQPLPRIQFDGNYSGTPGSYECIYERLGEIGNTYQASGGVTFHGGSPAVIVMLTGNGTDAARPGDWIVFTGQHTLRVERDEQASIDQLTRERDEAKSDFEEQYDLVTEYREKCQRSTDRALAAERQVEQLSAWGSPDGRTEWAEPLIEMLGDYHDEEACDCAADLAAEVVTHVTDLRRQVEQLSRVVEAARGFVNSVRPGDDPMNGGLALYDTLDAALSGYDKGREG